MKHDNSRRKAVIILVLAVSIILTACSGTERVSRDTCTLSEEERVYELSLLWKRSSELFGLWELVPDLDWDSVYLSYLPKVANAKTDQEFRRYVTEFVSTLQDGHTYITYRERKSFPFTLSYWGDSLYIGSIDPDKTSLPLAAKVISLNGKEPLAYLEEDIGWRSGVQTPKARTQYLATLLTLDAPDTLDITVQTPDGKTIKEKAESYLSVAYTEKAIQTRDFIAEYSYQTMHVYEVEDGIYQIVIPNFGSYEIIDELNDFLSKHGESAKGFILDVRDNPGGIGSYGAYVLWFFSHEQSRIYYDYQNISISQMSVAREVQRKPEEYDPDMLASPDIAEYLESGLKMWENRNYRSDTWEPVDPMTIYRKRGQGYDFEWKLYQQPVAILCNYNSGSGAEHFAAYAKGNGAFTVMGTNTAGVIGPSTSVELPDGGLFWITIARSTMVKNGGDADLTNVGVEPDILVEQTQEDALNGVDTALVQAIQHIHDQSGK